MDKNIFFFILFLIILSILVKNYYDKNELYISTVIKKYYDINLNYISPSYLSSIKQKNAICFITRILDKKIFYSLKNKEPKYFLIKDSGLINKS